MKDDVVYIWSMNKSTYINKKSFIADPVASILAFHHTDAGPTNCQPT
jgi:hypothetical protein